MLLRTSIPLRANGTVVIEAPGGAKYVFLPDGNGDVSCDVQEEDAANLLRYPDVHFTMQALQDTKSAGVPPPAKRGRPPKSQQAAVDTTPSPDQESVSEE